MINPYPEWNSGIQLLFEGGNESTDRLNKMGVQMTVV
uniref:Uncharacterized protein n=1 Tax=Anguilla anguilla TaxID=7936 RepID=A0A0E9WXR8_ANGAN